MVSDDLRKTKMLKQKYANNVLRSTYLIFKRFMILWIRDKRVIYAGLAKNIIMGISVGGVFFNAAQPYSILGVFFQAGLFIMLGMFAFLLFGLESRHAALITTFTHAISPLFCRSDAKCIWSNRRPNRILQTY